METTSEKGIATERIALALSGGGSRAIAFHLGCLKALHAVGVLERIEAISAVSGGSVIAALYCHQKGDFAAFEAAVRTMLAHGFIKPAIKKAVTTLEGVKALLCVVPLSAIQLAVLILRLVLRFLPMSPEMRLCSGAWLREPWLRRFASRTTILRRVLSDNLFEGQTLAELRDDRPKLIVVACELRSKSAFYFARDAVGSWRLGEVDPAGIEIAHAVAASAAYPGLLPALDEYLIVEKGGSSHRQRVVLTDGGVYDNLGLAPLWPDRDPSVSLHADKFDDHCLSRRLRARAFPTADFLALAYVGCHRKHSRACPEHCDESPFRSEEGRGFKGLHHPLSGAG
jgi:NTE family protein